MTSDQWPVTNGPEVGRAVSMSATPRETAAPRVLGFNGFPLVNGHWSLIIARVKRRPLHSSACSSKKIHLSTSILWSFSADAYSFFFTRLDGEFITIWIFSLGMWCFKRSIEAS